VLEGNIGLGSPTITNSMISIRFWNKAGYLKIFVSYQDIHNFQGFANPKFLNFLDGPKFENKR